ncbi:hypothetical protein H310_02768 [Aphanomyces invadans]|uniref:Uncharacterized protein n=1 Tax=Aphanomyces invadans TaxID=157072 RepID=A0A024UJC5_9STRA|nr:hypothetical protein H310_02768 [Aphanomyces invadans]ETW06541.1 hypothetical protein H310_02768 [Aphanomyces invadans]|eukprot:XP_008864616.1 hypothetical protein H310_02768 [Aphanomyces invadans]
MSSAAAKELQAEYQASRLATKEWIQSAKKAIAVRNAAGPPTGPAQFFQRFAYNYGTRHVHTNSVAPLVHILLIVGMTGITSTYLGRHRNKHAAQAAKKGDHHDAHHH